MATFTVIFVVLLLAFLIATVWPVVADDRTSNINQKIAQIEKHLPQTQCGDCGFNGCRPYANAIANESAGINRCLPGGDKTIIELSLLLGMPVIPLYKDSAKYSQASVAVIDEEICIGCVKCVRACPVDAIMGAAKQMHSVINQYCTGCELCIEPCPVDCISMKTI